MFLDSNASLRELLVIALAQRRECTADRLRVLICERHRKCSLQAVYLELGKLMQAGVVLKVKDRYELTLSWVSKLEEFACCTADDYFSRPSKLFQLPAPGKKLRLVFSDLKRCDRFWMQSMIKLLETSATKQMFQWLPHPWHQLVHGPTGGEFEKTLRRIGAKDYIIVGGDSYLDRQARKSWAGDIFVHSAAPGPFACERTDYISISGDFILTTSYPLKIVKMIDRYFCEVVSRAEVNARALAPIFASKMKIVVKLEHNPKEAEKFRRKFLRYFGETA